MRISKTLLAGVAGLLLTAAQAEAACVKPLGRYGGTWTTGAGLCTNTGSVCEPQTRLAMTISYLFKPDGSGTYGEWGKRLVSNGTTERFSRTVAFGAMGQPTHTFNEVTCRGVMTLGGTDKFVYVVTGDGKTIRGVEFAASGLFVTDAFEAEKL